ncbi:MAG: PilZ domain-containing protein [Deltaproteobacteria bacterium]|nr:PilZ domain-containing protein [Deltaproteobacteria bacterium]
MKQAEPTPHRVVSPEVRCAMRYPLETETILFDARGAQQGMLKDISIHGMGLHSERPLSVGQEVEALIMLNPGGRPLRMVGSVRWSRGLLCGVHFTGHDCDFARSYLEWGQAA